MLLGTLLAEMKTNGILAPVEWSPDGETIAVVVRIGGWSIQFWDAETYLLREKFFGLEIDLMDWSPVNNRIATIYDPGFGQPYIPSIYPGYSSTSEWVTLCPDECAQEYARSVKWNHGGTKVAIGSTGGIKIVEVISNQVILDIVTESGVYTLDWSYDDRFLVGLSNGVKIWSAETGELLDTFGPASAVDFSPNAYEIAYVDASDVDLVIQDVSYLLSPACNIAEFMSGIDSPTIASDTKVGCHDG